MGQDEEQRRHPGLPVELEERVEPEGAGRLVHARDQRHLQRQHGERQVAEPVGQVHDQRRGAAGRDRDRPHQQREGHQEDVEAEPEDAAEEEIHGSIGEDTPAREVRALDSAAGGRQPRESDREPRRSSPSCWPAPPARRRPSPTPARATWSPRRGPSRSRPGAASSGAPAVNTSAGTLAFDPGPDAGVALGIPGGREVAGGGALPLRPAPGPLHLVEHLLREQPVLRRDHPVPPAGRADHLRPGEARALHLRRPGAGLVQPVRRAGGGRRHHPAPGHLALRLQPGRGREVVDLRGHRPALPGPLPHAGVLQLGDASSPARTERH